MPAEKNQQSEIEQLRARVAELEGLRSSDSSQTRGGGPIIQSTGIKKSLDGKKTNYPLYRFRVHCMGKIKDQEASARYPDQIIKTTDESEAIRLFCLAEFDDRGEPKEPRYTPIDSSLFSFQTTCLDADTRTKAAVAQYEAANIPREHRPAYAQA